MIKVKVVGAGGYGGVGIIELLHGHPDAELSCLVDVENIGVPISRLYPHLAGFCDKVIVDAASPEARTHADVVFFATPDGVGMKLAAAELAAGARVVDYSGDFRFNTPEAYADYATRIGRDPKHAVPELLPVAAYGLAELHRSEVAKAKVVGNPGCFAVSCTLGLAPAAARHLVRPSSMICDCKTGVSGAGKKPSPTFHYPARYEQMNAYKLAGHQHVCEIERELSALAGTEIKITFTAQVVPVCRGIMSCLYGELEPGINAQAVRDAYRDFYEGEPFVKIFDRDSGIGNMQVRATNRCLLIVDVDERTNRLRVVSHIDNLVKGQAGSALQNMNILMGLKETAGLDQPGRFP